MYQAFLKLRRELAPYWKWMAAGIALAPLLAALRAAPPAIFKFVIDDVLLSKNADQLPLVALSIFGVYLLNFFVRFFHAFPIRLTIASVNRDIKSRLFKHTLGLSSEFFGNSGSGALVSRIGADPQLVDNGIYAIGPLVRDPVTVLALVGYTFYLSWQLTLFTLLVIPLSLILFLATNRNLRRYVRRMQEENAKFFESISESLNGIRIVKLFNLERYVEERAYGRLQKGTIQMIKTARLEEASRPMIELIGALGIAAILYYGGTFVVHEAMTAGELTAFFFSFALIIDPLRRLNDINIHLSYASSALDRIYEVLSWTSTIKEPTSPHPIAPLKQGLEFRNVSFQYLKDGHHFALKDISFTLNKGETLALVGRSGAGKSSLISLIPRLFDVSSGSILFDGIDIRDFRLDDLRSEVSVVSQEVFLFNDSIYENIRCGRLDATRAEIEEAARRAYALDFIRALPEGFETQIGERGQKLSGGERQRISIARAFLRKASLLVLDEATSNLDTESEQMVQQALEKLRENRTALVIAHRLSTIRNASQILVMSGGRVVERGTHEALSSRPGEYSKLLALSQV